MAVYLGLGSNIGDRLQNLHAAIAHFSVVQKSSIYETEPVDFIEQPWFYNAVIRIDTQFSPQELLYFCQEVEHNLGRKREIPKGPRVIDIDLLFYGDFTCSDANLILPHPEIVNRRFVLEPLTEIAPDFIHPVLNKSIAQLLLECKDESVVRKVGAAHSPS